MNHLIQTTSLPKIRQERCLLRTLVLLPRMGFTSDRFGFANLSLRNYQLTILCRENLRLPPRHFYYLEERNDPLVPESNIPQKEYYRVDRNVYRHCDNSDKISYSHLYPNPSSRNHVYGVLDGSPRRNTSARNTN